MTNTAVLSFAKDVEKYDGLFFLLSVEVFFIYKQYPKNWRVQEKRVELFIRFHFPETRQFCRRPTVSQKTPRKRIL